MPDIRLPSEAEPDDDVEGDAVHALAEHLTDALEAYLAQHLPPPDQAPRPDGLNPKSLLAGVTMFHASFLVDLARGVFTEPGAAATFFAVQVRTFKDALEVFHEEEDAS
jgi:hypothetical protein